MKHITIATGVYTVIIVAMGMALWFHAHSTHDPGPGPGPDPDPGPSLRLGMRVTLLSHPKYKGLIGTPLTIQAIEPPFIVVDWDKMMGDSNITILDLRETVIMPISKEYYEAANGTAIIIWRSL